MPNIPEEVLRPIEKKIAQLKQQTKTPSMEIELEILEKAKQCYLSREIYFGKTEVTDLENVRARMALFSVLNAKKTELESQFTANPKVSSKEIRSAIEKIIKTIDADIAEYDNLMANNTLFRSYVFQIAKELLPDTTNEYKLNPDKENAISAVDEHDIGKFKKMKASARELTTQGLHKEKRHVGKTEEPKDEEIQLKSGK